MALGSPVTSLRPLSGDGTGSSVALAKQGDRRLAIIADSDAKMVRVVDTDAMREGEGTPLSGAPSEVVVGSDGRVYVAVRDRAEVDVLELSPADDRVLRVVDRVATAEEPTGVSLTPDGRTLLVACGWGHALDVFSVPGSGSMPSSRTLQHRFRADLAREPRAVVASEDGTQAYVAHASASLVSVVDLDTTEHEVEAVRFDVPSNLHAGQTVQWRQGFALARTEMGILAPGVTAETGDTTVRTATYGGVDETSMPAENFSVQLVHPHVPGGLGDADVPSRMMTSGISGACLLPRAAAYDPKGHWLVVACQGQDQVIRIDAGLRGSASRQGTWDVGGEVTGVAVDSEQRTFFVWSERTHTLTGLDLDSYHPGASEEDATMRTASFGGDVDMGDPDMLGRALFHRTGDTRISSDGRACASCHPDGRDDGLTWATPDGPRQTPTLAGRLAGTAPYGWNGARSTVKQHVRGTLKRLGGTGLDAKSMDALVSYCMHMDPSPKATEPAVLTEQAALVTEGQQLFDSDSTGCSSCHFSDGTFTDGNRHNVHSKAKGDVKRRFDTPSLRFVAGTAPYFHDGRYPTLRALLAGSDGKMGHTKQLSAQDVDALEAYLKTL
jgi:cytochrome c peroxidase